MKTPQFLLLALLGTLTMSAHAQATLYSRNPFCDEGTGLDSEGDVQGGSCQVDLRIEPRSTLTGMPTFRETGLNDAQLEPAVAADAQANAEISLDISGIVAMPGQLFSFAEFAFVPDPGRNTRALVFSLANVDGRIDLIGDFYEMPGSGAPSFFCSALDGATPEKLLQTATLPLGDPANDDMRLIITMKRDPQDGRRYVSVARAGADSMPIRIDVDAGGRRDLRFGYLRNGLVAWQPAPIGTGVHLQWWSQGLESGFLDDGRIGSCATPTVPAAER